MNTGHESAVAAAPAARGATEFDIAGPLPAGTTVLEASAGTGKTWMIAALVARYVAEGTPLERILVVTFGRAATQELRERVRERLTSAEHFLARTRAAGAGARPEPSDDLLRVLVAGIDDAELEVRHRRLREALGAFDDATIATIHQFCHGVLRNLGIVGDSDRTAVLLEDLSDLRDEVVDDLYLARYAAAARRPLTHGQARELGEKVTTDPFARLTPDDASPGSVIAVRVDFAEAIRREFARRKRRLGVLGYDDLLADLAAALVPDRDHTADPDGPDPGPGATDGGRVLESPARQRMQSRWSVVLVDEFQDTDPIQWQVFRRAFHDSSATMVLIGDPKQAIYAFRGGDIDTYVAARRAASTVRTLSRNRRSDAPLVEAIGVALEGLALGHEDIVVPPAHAHHGHSRLLGAPRPGPWRMRVATPEALGGDGSKAVAVGQSRPAIAADVAADIHTLLAEHPRLVTGGSERPLSPGDIAVLCHTGAQLALVRDALRARGIAAVLASDESVFAAPAAVDWLILLEAMEAPNRTRRVRTAALTGFLGISPHDLDADPGATEEAADRLRRWAELFGLRGVPAVLEAATIGGLATRVLGRPGGERELTDLRHLAELLHEHATRDNLGLSALTGWLRRQIAEPAGRSAGRARRLDSDAAAVQLATIHASKGLQFPVVYAPYLCDRHVPDIPVWPRYHDERGRRCLDVGHDPTAAVVGRASLEEDGESLRLLYVALTRAQSHLVTWWAPVTTAARSPLHRLFFGRDPAGVGSLPPSAPVPRDPRVIEDRFTTWMDAGGPRPEWMVPAAPGRYDPPAARQDPQPVVRTLGRTIDQTWGRSSYSSLSRAAEQAQLNAGTPGLLTATSEPEAAGKDDEALGAQQIPGLAQTISETNGEDRAAHPAGAGDAPGGSPEGTESPMADLPVGATFGSLVHAVLEEADPQASDPGAEFRSRIEESQARWPVELNRSILADALIAVTTTPLGPLAGDRTLRQIGRADRLCEMEFELPLAGGDSAARGQVHLRDLAPLLRSHLPEDDPVRPYADALEDPALGDQPLHGYLTGSVDVVLRVGERYLVVDYKTNWLGAAQERLCVEHYRHEHLVAAMQHSSYPLQALLYAVVLHRFLRWRLPGYDPERHLGGVLYLYLRGMNGPDTPVIDGSPTGVFAWRPPAPLVIALSDLLDGSGS